MKKVRIYELAKELNTTSKRLMEKLAEINIIVKNHMSLLESHELEALYKHIGIITRDAKKDEVDEKKAVLQTAPPKQEVKRDMRSVPRIIRTTEIIVNSRNEDRDLYKSNYRKGDTHAKSDRKSEYIRQSDANTGLLAGFVRKSKQEYPGSVDTARKANQNKPAREPSAKLDPSALEKAEDTKTMAPAPEKKDIAPAQIETDKSAKAMEQKPPAAVTAAADSGALTDMNEDTGKANEVENLQPAAKTRGRAAKASNAQTGAQAARQQAKDDQSDEKPQDGRSQRHDTESQVDKPQEPGTQKERPQGGRSRGDRQPYQGARPQSERQPYQGARPQSERQPYQGARPQSERPSYQGDRPQGEKPRYQGDRPQGERPRYQGARPQGERPPYQGDRPQGERPRYQGARPQGERPRYQGARPQAGQGYRPGSRPLDIPKPDLTAAQKEGLGSQKSESRREYIGKDLDKDVRREQRKEAPKAQPVKTNRKIKTANIGLSEMKGVSEILSEDFILNEFYNDTQTGRKRQSRPRRGREQQAKHIPQRAVLTSIKIPESITVKDLAEALKKTSADVIKKLMVYGMMATLNQVIDFDTAAIIAEEYGVKTEKEIIINEEDILFDETEQDDPAKLVSRPPVVVVMGHVDHGKTSLLDAIRSTHVIESEAGGITQHIGAYTVKIGGRNITFLDTPGHEAFTAMRARGAQVTDIAILVVAADDGVMPQTIEAINHAKAANVSIIVAINKIDKPGANPDRVKQELTQHGLVSEEWGGDVICVNVSAKKRENIDQLLEMVLLTADVLELKADPDRQAKGTVIEAKLDKNRGPLATVLVQRGTLSIGDSIVTGTAVGRIRAMVDDKGNPAKNAGPSTPVELLGLPEVPEAGELFYAIKDEKIARQLAEKRKFKQKEQQMNATSKVSLDDLYKQIQEGKVKDLNIIIKADVQGSVEAVKQSLEKLSNEEVRINVIHGGVGAITESDVTLASVSNAIIIGFNVRPGSNVVEAAEFAGVDIRLYRIIYNAIEDIEAAMKGMLEPSFKETVSGHTEVRQIFKASGVGTIAGCYVLDGKINRNNDIRIIRDGIVIHEGKLASLKRFKDDVKEVLQGYECGLSVDRFNDIKEKDIVEAFAMEEVERQL